MRRRNDVSIGIAVAWARHRGVFDTGGDVFFIGTRAAITWWRPAGQGDGAMGYTWVDRGEVSA